MSEELTQRNVELRLQVVALELDRRELVKSVQLLKLDLATWQQIAIAAAAKAEMLEQQRLNDFR